MRSDILSIVILGLGTSAVALITTERPKSEQDDSSAIAGSSQPPVASSVHVLDALDTSSTQSDHELGQKGLHPRLQKRTLPFFKRPSSSRSNQTSGSSRSSRSSTSSNPRHRYPQKVPEFAGQEELKGLFDKFAKGGKQWTDAEERRMGELMQAKPTGRL